MSQVLYNGIELPDNWPPQDTDLECSQPQRVPYLEKRPEVVNIDVGRQLFVDDFLINKHGTEMSRKYHQAVKYPGNPIMFPQTKDELNEEMPPCSVSKSGGVWFDAQDKLFKMWYMASYLGYSCYATSKDGIHWERPELDVVPGTNLCLPRSIHPDSGSVIIDYDASPAERYKRMLREPDGEGRDGSAMMMTSPDGIHWTEPKRTGNMGDRSTLFYNPFRQKWVQSIRTCINDAGRTRHYNEDSDFYKSGGWDKWENTTPWLRADCMDMTTDIYPQLYNFNSIAYESLMIGFHQILMGPPNNIGEASGMPKRTEIGMGYSRDGFHYHRPDRRSFIDARREPGSWEYGYVESSAGMCHIVGDELWLYYSAYAGDPKRANADSWYVNGTYANGAVGLAKLRRDGFASMQARFPNATLVTRLVKFSGGHLFVNANTVGDKLRVEVQDKDFHPIKGFGFEDCLGFTGNSTAVEIRWKNADISDLAGQAVRFKFEFDRGDIYSFWVSKSEAGESNGYVAAGGPGFTGPTDTVGINNRI
jgi:hypothetical protein